MYVLLPSAPGANALKEFKQNLNADILINLIHQMKNQTCIVAFPKMKLSSSLSLKNALKSLGLVSLFDPLKADLSLLSPGLNKTVNLSPLKESGIQEDRTLRAQDGFYFPPRIGENSQENMTVDDRERKNYFRYEDKLRGYSVEQWANGYNIERIHRKRLANLQRETSTVSVKDLYQAENNKGNNKESNKENRRKRQSRPIDQDFLNFLDAKNLPSFGLDTLRNSANIENPGLYAKDVLHKVEININEKGTEAAAATAVALERTGNQKKFIANRPFLFFIRHEPSKIIWFWGTVNTPTPNYP